MATTPSTSADCDAQTPPWARELVKEVRELKKSNKALCRRMIQVEDSNRTTQSRINVLIARLEKHERGAFGRSGLHTPLSDVSPLEAALTSKPSTSGELVIHSTFLKYLGRLPLRFRWRRPPGLHEVNASPSLH